MQKVVTELKQANESLRAQQTGMIPVVPDVPRIRIKHDKVYSFEQSIDTTVVGSATLETDTVLTFYLSLFGNSGAFQTAFDTYRILQVVIQFIPQGGAPSTSVPIYTAIDYDDTATTALSSLLEYDTLQSNPSGTYFQRILNPRIAVAAYAGSSFSGYAQGKAMWIDCNSPATQHYGLKVAIPPSSSLTPPTYQIVSTALFQFKNVR
jgi:hypothetical protein